MMITDTEWLIDETLPISVSEYKQLGEELGKRNLTRGARQQPCQLAVTLKDIIIYDNKKWFGEADIRLDAFVVTGYGRKDEPGSFYRTETETFPRVEDGERLPIGDGGLQIFHGEAQHFLDIRIMVSRDRKDTDSLASLLKRSLQSEEMTGALGSLMGLAMAAPQAAAVAAAVGGAAVLGEFAYSVLREATGKTIGFYRNSHRQYSDNFGIGAHPGPPPDCYRAKDLSFRYDITLEEDDPYAL